MADQHIQIRNGFKKCKEYKNVFYLKGTEEQDDFVAVFETQVPECDKDSQNSGKSELYTCPCFNQVFMYQDQ